MGGLLLRPAVPADAVAVAEVFLAARGGMDYLPRLHSDAETRAWIAGSVLPGCAVTVAVEGDAVIGFAAVDGSWLEHLYVHPEAHGRGAGSRLLEHAKAGADGLDLFTFQRNAGARRFYERHGFVVHAWGDGTGNEEGEPDIHYRWIRSR